MYRASDFPEYTLHLKDEKKKGTIVWIFTGPWRMIDNFAETPVRYLDKRWPTSEHAYAALKAATRSEQERIRKAKSPGEAKMLGRMTPLRKDWETVKFAIMWDILCAKFAQSEVARSVLMATRGRDIVEGNTWNDRIWGMTADPVADFDKYTGTITGQNALGKMLMAIRDRA